MDPEVGTLQRAIELMEDALELLDSIDASDAGALLDHAIHAARDRGNIVGDRRASGIESFLEGEDMTSFGEPGTSGRSRLIEDPNHPFKADRA